MLPGRPPDAKADGKHNHRNDDNRDLGLTHDRPFEPGFLISGPVGAGWLARSEVEEIGMMHFAIRTTLTFACVAILATLSMGASYLSYLAISLQPGDQISVHIDGTTLSSSSSNPGDTFQIVAAEPFLAQGNVAVISGAVGQGHVVSIAPAKNGKPAAVAIQLDWITSVDGQHVPIAATKKGDPLIFGAGGPYEKNYSKDKPVTVGSDLLFMAYVTQQVSVQVNPT